MKCYIVNYPLSSFRDIRNLGPNTQFESAEYAFLSPIEFAPGTICIAESRNGLGLVKVIREAAITSVASRFLLGAINIEQLKASWNWYAEQEELRKRIEQRVKDIDQEQRMKALAATDPELQRLINELERKSSAGPLLLTAAE